MTYSLVGAPAVGFDLTRLAGGTRVAAVLRTALAADAGTLQVLAARSAGPGRDSFRVLCQEHGAEGVGAVLPDVAPSLADPAAAGSVLHRLESGLLGDLEALDRLVRHELLEHTWIRSGPVASQDPEAASAADVLVDAAAAAFVGTAAPEGVRRAMTLPLVGARLALRDDVPVGVDDVDGRLARLGQADAEVRAAWRRVVDGARGSAASWAPAMHQATWALLVTDRLRPAFDAQMAAVLAFARAGFTARDAAYGVWNAVSGVVQASMVGDLLPSRDADLLLAPWRAVHGD